jgi:CHAT domain-containing protein
MLISQPHYGTQDVLIAADPTASLSGANLQAKVLASLLRGRARLLTGSAVTRENILEGMANFRWLHFAMHGVYDANNPLLCGLPLAGRPGPDGDAQIDFFGFGDLMNQKLNAEMVVLSSCNSARGRFEAGEGILSLAWGFLRAGSSDCIGSQWEAVDESTAKLMTNFYFRLAKPATAAGKKQAWKAECLAAAQSDFVRGESVPGGRWKKSRYWAPFVLIGDPR